MKLECSLSAPATETPNSETLGGNHWSQAETRLAYEQTLRHLVDRGFIQFHPALADRFGHKAALFLGLALYWTRHTVQNQPHRKGWFYMSARQWQESVGLSAREQSTARALLIGDGLLQESLTGRPAVLHFRVDLSKLSQALDDDADTAHQEPKGDPLLLRNSVCFYKPLADLTGNLACGLYLSYLLQMQRRALMEQRVRIDAVKVSQHDVSIALRLGPKVQRNARDRLQQAGLLRETGSSLVLLNLPAIIACLQVKNGRVLPRGRKSSKALTLGVAQAPETASGAVSGPSLLIDVAEIGPLHSRGAQLPLGWHSLANLEFVTAVALDAGTGIQGALSDLRSLIDASLASPARANQVARSAQVPNAARNRSFAAIPMRTTSPCAAESAKLNSVGRAQTAKLSTAGIAESAKLELPKTQPHISISLSNTTTPRAQDRPVDDSAETSKPRRRRFPNPIVTSAATVADDSRQLNIVDQGTADLVFPQELDPTFLRSVSSVLVKVPAAQRQPLLDELGGQLRIQSKTIHNPAGWLVGLIRQQRLGSDVVLAMADKVAEDRKHRQRVQHQVARATRREGMPSTAPEPAQTANPVVRQEALLKLSVLRAAMVAKVGQR